MRRFLRWCSLAVVIVLLGAGFMTPRVAEAHAFLVQSKPQSGERLGASPAAVRLQFSEEAASSQITVKAADGALVKVGPIRLLQGGLVAQVTLPALPAGVYVVSWQNVSADDGHENDGEFAFAVGTAGQLPTSLGQSANPIAWPEAAAGWLILVPLFVAVGGLASERFLWRTVAQRHRVVVPPVPVGWLIALALVGAILQLVLLVGRLVSSETARDAQAFWSGLVQTPAGALGVVQIALLVLGLQLLSIPRARSWLLVPLTFALIAAALRSHAVTTPFWWAAPTNVVHLLAVALWVGGLGHLVLIAWKTRQDSAHPALDEGTRRYATVALGLVALVVATGVAEALAQFTTPTDLFSTTYGRALLIKGLLAAVAVGLAFTARRWALPANAGLRLGLLRRLTRAESIALLTVVAAASVLANAPPPRAVASSEDLLGPPPLEGPVVRQAMVAGLLTVYVDAAEDRLQIQVLAPSGDPASDAHLAIEGGVPGGTDFDVQPRSCGPGCLTSALPWKPGTTTLLVDARSPTLGGGTVSFGIPWPPQPEDPALLDQVIQTMKRQPRINLVERVSPAANGAVTNTFSLTGQQFVANEIYANGGASDVRPVPAPEGFRALTLYIPGSSIWYRLEIDSQDRLRRETIVDPGHLIERTFQYGSQSRAGQAGG